MSATASSFSPLAGVAFVAVAVISEAAALISARQAPATAIAVGITPSGRDV